MCCPMAATRRSCRSISPRSPPLPARNAWPNSHAADRVCTSAAPISVSSSRPAILSASRSSGQTAASRSCTSSTISNRRSFTRSKSARGSGYSSSVRAAAMPRSRLICALMPSSRCCDTVGRQRPAASKATCHAPVTGAAPRCAASASKYRPANSTNRRSAAWGCAKAPAARALRARSVTPR
ncbi:hypothetical protein D3C72_1641420 [compost metagenome]